MSTNIHTINERDRVRGNGADRRDHWHEITGTMNEAKEEFKQFAETRFAMLQSEMKEKMDAVKASAPMIVIGAVLGLTAFFLITGAIVSLVMVAFKGSPYAPFLAFLIVGVVYGLIGGIAAFVGIGKIKENGLVPERTIKVLKADRAWLQNEARTQV